MLRLLYRLLVLATCFATKMIRKYGLLQHKNDNFVTWSVTGRENCHLPSSPLETEYNQMGNSKRLWEMSHFLEIIRNLQCRLSTKIKRPAQSVVGCFVVLLA